MAAVTTTPPRTRPVPDLRRRGPSRATAFATLSRRRFSLSAHTPREILVPLLTPILFADVIAPALAKTIPATHGLEPARPGNGYLVRHWTAPHGGRTPNLPRS